MDDFHRAVVGSTNGVLHFHGLNDHEHLTGADDLPYLRVLVGQLRQKLEAEPSAPKLILTEPGVGYRFMR